MSRRKSLSILVPALFLGFAEGNFAQPINPPLQNNNIEYREITLKKEIEAPEKFGRLVESHVHKMISSGYTSKMDPDDLFHGHILIRNSGKDSYLSLGDVINDTRMVLYHTCESPALWETTNHAGRKTPRSIMGFPNGHILPAEDMIREENISRKDRYENYGTIYQKDIIKEYPSLEEGPFKSIPQDENQFCRLLFEFSIKPNPSGKYAAGSQRFDVHFRCYEGLE
jgi:hypothetical protein